MKIGTATVTAIYLGTTSIVSAYLGATQVFGGTSVFTPLSLFSTGAQGVWYDPSDLSTMFSDRAGTIPVTTPGTVVGKRLDKSGRGNHATAPADAARPIYGVEPKGGRRNLLDRTEELDNAYWLKAGVVVTTNQATDGQGSNTLDLIADTPDNASHIFVKDLGGVATGNTYTLSVEAQDAGRRYLTVGWYKGSADWVIVTFDLQTGLVTEEHNNDFASGFSFLSSSMALISGSLYRCTITTTPRGGTIYPRFHLSNSATPVASGTANATTGAPTYVGNGSGVYVGRAQLELGSTATNYQRVTTAYDVTESGVPTCHYVQYDGSDDSMSTAAIDFTGTDKMSVFAGVNKLTDTAAAIFVELSATTASNTGSFYVSAPEGTGALRNFGFRTRGAATGPTLSSGLIVAPVTRVATFLGDISGDSAIIRLDGTQVAQSTSDQGTGNFGSYPLFIGRRNNATLPFNGKDYGLIIVGKAASAGEITDTETWLAAKTAQVTL